MNRMRRLPGAPLAVLMLAAFALTTLHAQAEDRLRLAIGQRGNWETAASELGQNAGFFKKRGLVLELLYTQGSAETQQAAISGSVDVGIGLGTTAVMSAFAKGAPLRVIGNASTGSSEYWYVPANSPIRSMKDVSGKTIAFSTVGASSNLEVLAFLKAEGIAAKPVATGGPAATFTQVMSGQIDVGWASPPFGLDAAHDGKIRIIARGAELPDFRDQTIRVIVAHAPYWQQHRDVLARFVQAYRDTLAWMYEDEAALEAYAELAHTSAETAKEVRDVFYPRPGMAVDNISGLDRVMADGVAYKYLPAPLTKDQLQELFQVPAPVK